MGQRLDGIALAALRLGSLSGSIWEDADYDGLRREQAEISRMVDLG
jgi:hypothetical protein